MPTENRSSNTDMVSVPRELAEGIVRMLQGSGGWKTAEQLSALLAQQAEQHQGEPVKPYGYLREVDGRCQLSVGPERPADRAGGYATPWAAVFAGEQVEKLRYKAELYDEVWELVTGLGYMNVTTAVTTLRAEVKRLDLMVAEGDHASDNLNAQLAERDALLRKLGDEFQKASDWICREVAAGTKAATYWATRLGRNATEATARLTDSAEPEAKP